MQIRSPLLGNLGYAVVSGEDDMEVKAQVCGRHRMLRHRSLRPFRAHPFYLPRVPGVRAANRKTGGPYPRL